MLPVGIARPAGEAAIYTDRVKPAHVIRKVILRQMAILNYVLPFWDERTLAEPKRAGTVR